MFDENGNFIQGNNILNQLQAIQEGTMSPAGPNPVMAPNGWWNNLTGGAGNGGILDTLKGFAPIAQLGFTGLQTIGGLIGANRAYGLAKDQFKHIRDVTNTNLTNQIQSYNTALADRARTRAAMEGGSQEDAERYIEQNRLRR